MKVVIAEKPSVAGDIAKVIGATTRKREWYEGNGYYVTWCYGHLLELSVPESKVQWRAENLPIIPEKFLLKPIPMTLRDGQRPRLDVIKELFDKCDSIVVATDAGREGELIFRNIYAYLGCRKPFRRLWISSLTEKNIRQGFDNLRDGSDYDNLAKAAVQRNQADWIVGINATRAMTVACGCKGGFVLSLGRVQTPTLCMICKRYIENARFKPEPFWFLDGASVKDGITFKWRSEGRYDAESCGSNEEAEKCAKAAREAVLNQGFLTVEKVETKRVTEAPPILYDIDTLQKDANSKYGYTLDQSLAIAQSLYEKKVTTYPRTSSRYIPEDVFETVPGLLAGVTSNQEYGQVAKALLKSGRLNNRSVNNNKISDHHAIIITENAPSGLSEEEQNVYNLVLVRFLEAFSEDCIADKTKVTLSGGTEYFFTTSGRKDQRLGWRAVAKTGDFEDVELNDIDEVELSMRPLPEMHEGDRIDISKLEVIEDKTKPKPLLTDATLLTEMEKAGQRSDDKEVAKALKEIGIGTAATRSETLKTLIARGYVDRKNKKLSPTNLGLEMFVAVKDKAIANVAMTARWEIALDDIKEGTAGAEEFEKSIKDYTVSLTKEILKGDGLQRIRGKIGEAMEKMVVKCPRCGREVKFSEKSAWCVGRKDNTCSFGVWREIAGKKLSDDTLRTLVQKGQTKLLSGFKGKKGEFNARLILDGDGKVSFEFEKRKS